MTTPVQQRAIDTINHHLQSAWNNPVTHGDVMAIAATLRGLSAADARVVIDQLRAGGKLDQFAREAVDGSILGLGGFSASERRAFFADMARTLDGTSLASLSRAFAATDNRTGGRDLVAELADAVATHASPAAKLAYVQALKGATANQPTTGEVQFGSSVLRTGDPEAAAIGRVIGSMRGAHAEAALQSLSGAELEAVLRASIGETARIVTAHPGNASMTISWNSRNFEALMDAAASTTNADLKARLFDAAGTQLQSVDGTRVGVGSTPVGRRETLAAMTDAMTRLLDSDTTGVVRELTYNRDSLDGTALAAYAKQMLQSTAGTNRLGELMARLQLGNDLAGHAIGRLNETVTVPGTNQERRENAGALGYFVGAVYRGAAAISSDVRAQQELATAVLKSALTVIDKAKVGGLAGGMTASVAKEWVAFAVREVIRDPGNSAAQQLERAALPINPATGELGVGDGVTNAFNTALDRVIRLARP